VGEWRWNVVNELRVEKQYLRNVAKYIHSSLLSPFILGRDEKINNI